MTEKWTRDTGLVFATLFLILGYRFDQRFLLLTALFLLLLMFAPNTLRPLARAWLIISETLGMVMNKVFFGLVFSIVIVPIALAKRFISGDQRDLARETVRTSALIDGRGVISGKDLAKPY